MNKSDFRGFKQVFLFEFYSGIKKTGFKAFIATLCALALFTMPVMIIVGKIKGDDTSSEKNSSKSEIESVYVYDDTGLSIDYDHFNETDKYSDVSFITDNASSYADSVKNLEENSDHKDLIIKSEYDENDGFEVTIVYAKESGIKKSSLENFEEDFRTFYREEILGIQNVSDEEYENLTKDIDITVLKQAKDGSFAEDLENISVSDYFVMLSGLIIVFMFINMSVGNIATSIATEKSSRVIEFLLTGTRPLALLSGKIVARLLETVITSMAVYSCYFLSQILCIFLVAGDVTVESASGNLVVTSSIWETITLSKMVIALLYFLAGLALYSIVGALAGASVSKLDELQDAYKFYTFLILLSFYCDMFLVILMLNSGVSEAFMNFCAIFPLTGAFLTPALILTGKISILTGTISLVIIIITAAVIFILASAIYESMLLFQGKRLAVKDIVALMKKQVVA